MKKNILKSALTIFTITALLFSCSKDDDNSNPDSGSGSSNLGTFVGTVQVSDDPQTQLGYIYNAKVSVSKNGSDVTIKLVGDLGVNREYTGTVFASTNNSTIVTINKQTKPSVKNATQNLVIDNNVLAFQVGVVNDSEKVKASPTATSSITISGKINLIGTGMIKE